MDKREMELIKELRARTGARIMDCSAALRLAAGDVALAERSLRESNLVGVPSGATCDKGTIGSYVHAGRIGVLVELSCETDFLARADEFRTLLDDICMHVAATAPKWVDRQGVPQGDVDSERAIQLARVPRGKPENIAKKIVDGRMDQFFKENCLVEQQFVRDTSMTIGQMIDRLSALSKERIVVKRFVRFELGRKQ